MQAESSSTTVVSALRFHALVVFSYSNFTYGLVSPTYWSTIEITVGILCVCLPTIRPFFRAIGRKFRLITTLTPRKDYDSYDLSDRPRYESATVDSENPKAAFVPKKYESTFATDVKSGMESSRPDSSTIGIPYARHGGALSRLESVITRDSYSNQRAGTGTVSRLDSVATRDSFNRQRGAMGGLSSEADRESYNRVESTIPSGFTSTAPRDSYNQQRTTMGGIDSVGTRDQYASGSESIPIGFNLGAPEEAYNPHAGTVSRMPSVFTQDSYNGREMTIPSAFDSMPPPPSGDYERSEGMVENRTEAVPSSTGLVGTDSSRASTGYTYQPTKQLGLFIPSYQK